MTDSYREPLRAALEAARAAGAILRKDFLKPGGPDGSGTHADADDRAEAVIRERLLAATPEWNYRGEETGYKEGSEGRHTWLVDPNDGTVSYLKGFRGSAVSIGLLRDGVPVLGVVYAFAAPDNNGDLFSWAEGCGPLERNGVPVERTEWHDGITPRTVTLVSQDADRASRVNLQCALPGRYQCSTSIAYRLALVAAGEAEAGSALEGTGDWDYCGGHALLLGVGGDLVKERGEKVTYTRDGRSSTQMCFGGAPAVVRELVHRPWHEVFSRREPSRDFDLARPARGETIADNSLLQRVTGCWLGQLTGDALGSMVEFRSGSDLRKEYPGGLREIGPSPCWNTIAGQPTDDSELALVLARTLRQTGRFDAEEVAGAYAYWLRSGPFDIGGTIGAATRAMVQSPGGEGLVAAARRAANQSSEANGAMMRQSPLAIWGHALAPDELDRIVREDAAITHPNRVCGDASAAFIVALAAAIHEGLDARQTYEQAVEWDRRHGASATVTDVLRRAETEPPDYGRHQGHVLVALQNVFYQALHAPTFEDGVVATVMGGGDTDTNGAIAGALLGAIHGATAVSS